MSKVYITDIGVNSPIGCGFDEALANIESGFKGLSEIKNFDTSYFPVNFSGEVKENRNVVITKPEVDRKALFIRHSLVELINKNDFLKRYQPEDLMLNFGAGIDYFDLETYVNSQNYKNAYWQPHCYRATELVKSLANQYNIKGGHFVNVSACVASSQAIGLSFRILKHSQHKAVVTGGFDSMLSHLHYLGFYKLGALSSYQGKAEEACKPFDKNRCGLVIGEGGIAILLENEDVAQKDKILGEVVGYSSSFDAYQVTDPEPTGSSLARAAMEAINEAGITPDEIDCAHLHETGTIKNAISESKAMQLIFGDRFKEIPVYSMKGQIGHLIGACGAMEMLGVVYSLKYQKVPVTVNFKTPDPEVPVMVVKDKPLDLKINYILKLNAAFGGQNSALVIKRV